MKKPLMAIGIAVLCIGMVLAGWYVINTQSATRQNLEPIATKPAQTTSDSTTKPTTSKPGQYIDYSAAALQQATGIKILFFHAPWCPQCRQLDQELTKASLPENTTIFKVDYDSNQALRQQYGVTLQTTFVRVDNKNALIQKYVAYNEPTYESLKTHIFP